MNKLNETNYEYWRRVLTTGGFTAIPQWTLNSTTGVDRYEMTLADDLVAALHRLTDELEVSLSSVLLTAHAKVLSALSGEQGVVTGYIVTDDDTASNNDADGTQLFPCRLMTETDSWRTLVLDTHRAEAALLNHKEFPVDDLKRELGLTKPLFETVFAPGLDSRLEQAEHSRDLPEDIVLWAGISRRDDQLVLQLRYQTELFDAECAARIAGYHITALTLITADLDVDHRQQSLLSAEELHFQIEGLAGPRRELPDGRFHELFEQHVQAHPDRVAAVCDGRQWSYQELNNRANQIGRALLAQGLQREGIVAVVTERNLDWMAAVIAIFKAGGVYLPVEPHFPGDRIATMLSRAECRIALTESGSSTTLESALESLPDVQMLFIDAIYEENLAQENLGISVEPDQLAYIYFTSGSTGEPKGAMCEHVGMLNHLYAKIDDLEIGNGQVVAQIAPQCFDISLWQLVSALLVGGHTLIVKQEVILDVERFIDTIIHGEVAVMQVVPSYLEVVLSYLDQHHHELPELKCVSVTGEALTKELTQRWFAAKPEIKLANAYGLTETSDDTNHEVMDCPPERDRVPLGPAVNNVHVYVVDEQLSPVPLGAPGEIVFSGVCVGRGYINDPDRTKLAYMDDPLREGERLYRSGDYGRWQPDGKLEFLGRRDAQIKIRGFRIEIGDIENALLQIPGVRHGAVVVAERTDQNKYLVAFYSGPKPLESDTLQEELSRSLPEYMVPSIFYWQDSLPLTANGKIDRKTLRKLAGEIESIEVEYQPPSTPTEQRLAAAWAKVLGIPEQQIGQRDHFFDLGGTSLSAVRLAIAMDRTVSLKDVTRNPVLAELADLVDGRTKRQSELLQLLSEPSDEQEGALICFPYAGGNAVNFQPMASILGSALGSNKLVVYAVELPGHDLAAASENFAPISEVVDQVIAEINQRGLKQILLWGHSSGAALAVETAKKLEASGVEVQRIFVAAQLLGNVANRSASITKLVERSNAEIVASLSADGGYTELSELDAQHVEHIGAAYRHDCVSAHRYFVNTLENPSTEKLSAPMTVVVAANDPATTGFAIDHCDWQQLATQVDLHELSDGGHYFLRTRPAETVEAVLRHVAPFTTSLVAAQ